MDTFEKKYKDAVRIAKSFYEGEAVSFLGTIFPELRESEDERIRKEMIEFLEQYKEDGLRGVDITLWIAYLEKQKEQKPVEKEITLTNFEETLNTFLFGFANSPIEDCEPKEYIKKHSTEILKAAYKELNAKLQQDIFEARQEGIRDGYEVAKAEQKPAEWSEEDQKSLNRAINICISDFGEDCQTARFLKCLPERFVLQPKQEWSEEDERNKDRAVFYARYYQRTEAETKGSEECISWLKDLPFSLKKKNKDVAKLCSNEWSDEDNIGWDEAFACVTRAEKAAKNEEELQNAVTAEKWLKEIKFKYYVHPVKQEWSWEDENVYKSIQTILLAESRFVEERKWFDSIKARIKPACWDEKDEKMRDRLIDRLQFITLNTRTDTTSPNITFFDEIDWLKSLRPSWKPSEEQIHAIVEALKYLPNNKDEWMILNTLADILMKLM